MLIVPTCTFLAPTKIDFMDPTKITVPRHQQLQTVGRKLYRQSKKYQCGAGRSITSIHVWRPLQPQVCNAKERDVEVDASAGPILSHENRHSCFCGLRWSILGAPVRNADPGDAALMSLAEWPYLMMKPNISVFGPVKCLTFASGAR